MNTQNYNYDDIDKSEDYLDYLVTAYSPTYSIIFDRQFNSEEELLNAEADYYAEMSPKKLTDEQEAICLKELKPHLTTLNSIEKRLQQVKHPATAREAAKIPPRLDPALDSMVVYLRKQLDKAVFSFNSVATHGIKLQIIDGITNFYRFNIVE